MTVLPAIEADTTTTTTSAPILSPPALTTTESPVVKSTTPEPIVLSKVLEVSQSIAHITPVPINEAPVQVTISTPPSKQALLPDNINIDRTEQLFDYLTKCFQNHLRTEVSFLGSNAIQKCKFFFNERFDAYKLYFSGSQKAVLYNTIFQKNNQKSKILQFKSYLFWSLLINL